MREELRQSASATVMVFMTDAADHVTGRTGLTLTTVLSKNGGAFASISPTVTERGYGWYALVLSSAHTDTMGDLVLHVTATGADPTDVRSVVRGRIASDDIPTVTETADAVLKRDFSAVTGEAARSMLNALRFLRNKWSLSGATLTVTKEDDVTSAWTAAVSTQVGAEPIIGSDPA